MLPTFLQERGRFRLVKELGDAAMVYKIVNNFVDTHLELYVSQASSRTRANLAIMFR